MQKQNYTREEVIKLVETILELGDQVMDAITNENTDWTAKELIDVAESYIEKDNSRIVESQQ